MDWNGVVEMFIASLSPNLVSNASRMFRVSQRVFLFFSSNETSSLRFWYFECSNLAGGKFPLESRVENKFFGVLTRRRAIVPHVKRQKDYCDAVICSFLENNNCRTRFLCVETRRVVENNQKRFIKRWFNFGNSFDLSMSLSRARTKTSKNENFTLHNARVNCIISFKKYIFYVFWCILFRRGCLCSWILREWKK